MKTILFDLDGTLLPMDINQFLKIYFHEMSMVFKDVMAPDLLVDTVMKATKIMVKDVTDSTNQTVFMQEFERLIGHDISDYHDMWDVFYDTTYMNAKVSSYERFEAIEAVKVLKEKGYQLVLATNPLFPETAILQRIQWAGLSPDDFSYITSFEKNHYCKPQIQFYQEIIDALSLDPAECMMVGNDAQEDMVASKLGMKTYLIEDHILDRSEVSHEITYRGNYEDFLRFAKEEL
ncbi:MAG: HAD family hydrolase [Vallitaleaceae bacterium]|jgi:FMN phosphatase YigB (HAD superfamily)|nr:HAD family hydrolase [Vallitaleaceae bacterium]